jgi:uncharacterized UBP type Zn finger protein
MRFRLIQVSLYFEKLFLIQRIRFFTENFADFTIFIFILNLIKCIRTTSRSTDVQHITSLYQIAYVQRIRCIKIVLQISNYISRLIFILNLIKYIRTTSRSTDVQHITSLYQIAYVQRIRCIKIVLQISNYISRLRMARRGRNT